MTTTEKRRFRQSEVEKILDDLGLIRAEVNEIIKLLDEAKRGETPRTYIIAAWKLLCDADDEITEDMLP